MLEEQQRTFAIARDAALKSEGDDGLKWMAISSEDPYERWWGIEILDHAEASVDMSRIADGRHPLLLNHDRHQQVGVLRKARLDADKKIRCGTEFSRSQLGKEAEQDVEDEIRTLVSVGYEIQEIIEQTTAKDGKKSARTFTFNQFEAELQRRYGDASHKVSYRDGASAIKKQVKSDDEQTVYRVTRWMPFEASLVAIPADATVGVGRAIGVAQPAVAPVAPSVVSPNTVAIKNLPKGNKMEDVLDKKTVVVDVVAERDAARKAEQSRIKEITAAAKRFNQLDLGEKHIEAGTSFDEFSKLLLQSIKPSAEIRTAEDPALGMSKKEVKKFSFLRAVAYASDPSNEGLRKAAAFELECSEASRAKMGDLKKEREGGLTIPTDVLNSPIEDLKMARAVLGAIQRQSGLGQRDLIAGTASLGGNTVATDLLGQSFIELFVNKMQIMALGATILRDLNGNVAIPRQNGRANSFWVAENGAVTANDQSFDQVALTPKTVGAMTNFSRRLLLQSSIDVEAFVRMDIARSLALAIDFGAIAGPGTANNVRGIINQAGIGSVAGGANGATPTWDNMVDLESAVANANADIATLSYLTNSRVRGRLKRSQQFSGTNGDTIWKATQDQNAPIVISNQVPSNLTKGTSNGVCSGILYGNWAELLIGMWGGLDVMLDPYTNAASGARRVVALQDVDINIRHPESFAAMLDALTV